ncbi:MAG: hypothetical protein JWO82_609 [Akkermansiaceae bacterium]|nr:hypothetical protein [Akkermansiaceae bacterium]
MPGSVFAVRLKVPATLELAEIPGLSTSGPLAALALMKENPVITGSIPSAFAFFTYKGIMDTVLKGKDGVVNTADLNKLISEIPPENLSFALGRDDTFDKLIKLSPSAAEDALSRIPLTAITKDTYEKYVQLQSEANPSAALEWIHNLPASSWQSEIEGKAIEIAARRDPEVALKYIANNGGNPELMKNLASGMAQGDLTLAIDFSSTLPPATKSALRKAI